MNVNDISDVIYETKGLGFPVKVFSNIISHDIFKLLTSDIFEGLVEIEDKLQELSLLEESKLFSYKGEIYHFFGYVSSNIPDYLGNNHEEIYIHFNPLKHNLDELLIYGSHYKDDVEKNYVISDENIFFLDFIEVIDNREIMPLNLEIQKHEYETYDNNPGELPTEEESILFWNKHMK